MRRIDKIREEYPEINTEDEHLSITECPGFYIEGYPIPKPNRDCELHNKGSKPNDFDVICKACWHMEDKDNE